MIFFVAKIGVCGCAGVTGWVHVPVFDVNEQGDIMPRVILTEQPVYFHEFHVVIKSEHINFAGHLDNGSVIFFAGQAREAMLKDMGFSEGDLGSAGVGIIIAEITVNFRSEGFLDEVLLIESGIGEISGRGFRFFHRICRGDRLIALAETGAAAFDYSTRKPVPVPEKFVKKIAEAGAFTEM
jgi:YbgC/YbaW family acyl-CoA thioester hydrolase